MLLLIVWEVLAWAFTTGLFIALPDRLVLREAGPEGPPQSRWNRWWLDGEERLRGINPVARSRTMYIAFARVRLDVVLPVAISLAAMGIVGYWVVNNIPSAINVTDKFEVSRDLLAIFLTAVIGSAGAIWWFLRRQIKE